MYIIGYILTTVFVSQLAIYFLSFKKIKNYCELSHHNRWTKCCAMIFPAIFVNLEKCYANYLLKSAIIERDMLHPKYQKTSTKAKAGSIRKIKKFDFQAYFKITQNINEKQNRLVEISKIHSLVTLLDTVLENYPQAIVMMSFLFLSLKCEKIRFFFQNNLRELLIESEKTGDVKDAKWYEGHKIVLLSFAVQTVFTLVFVVRRIRYVLISLLLYYCLSTYFKLQSTLCI